MPACDVSTYEALEPILAAANEGVVGALKIGFSLGERFGVPNVAAFIRERTKAPIIYDKQKAGTDIPHTGAEFADIVKSCDAAIVFPLSGPETQRVWTSALQDSGLRVIIGAVMTHPHYLQADGGYVTDEAPRRIIELAIEQGVRDFIVPATNPTSIQQQRELIERFLAAGDYDLYAPGLIAQGGSVEELRHAAGPRWHAIVGRAIYKAEDPLQAVKTLAKSLVSP